MFQNGPVSYGAIYFSLDLIGDQNQEGVWQSITFGFTKIPAYKVYNNLDSNCFYPFSRCPILSCKNCERKCTEDFGKLLWLKHESKKLKISPLPNWNQWIFHAAILTRKLRIYHHFYKAPWWRLENEIRQ